MDPKPPPGDTGDDCPPHVRELSDSCVRYVQQALKLTLDYSQETLPILDHYLRQVADAPEADVAGEQLRALLAPTAGAYFGELVRRNLPGARWHAPGDDYANYRLELPALSLRFNPVGVAQEVIDQADAPGWHGHFAMPPADEALVEQTLAQSLSLREQDYYSLSVRYETLEQVVSVLEALAQSRRH